MRILQPLDFVKTPDGGIAIVTERNPAGNGLPERYSITYIYKSGMNAWWSGSDLEYLTNLPLLLAEGLTHPFSSYGKSEAQKTFKP